MADYNLGRAHGTIRIDYDGKRVKEAQEDIKKVGRDSAASGTQVDAAADQMRQAYENISRVVRQLSTDVGRHASAETAAKARIQAAEEALAAVRAKSGAAAKDIANAEKAVQRAQTQSAAASQRLSTSTRALQIARQKLANTPNPDQKINVDTSGMDRVIARLKSIDANTKKSASGINVFSGRLKIMAGAVGIAAPHIAGLGVSLVALAGTAGVAAGALAGVAAVAGTIAIGMSGIGAVFKGAAADAKSAGSSAGASAKAQRSAAQAIESAKRSLVDAEINLKRVQEDSARAAVQAARAILSAQRDLVNAQRDAVRAQENLTKARRDATRQLEDMRLALVGGSLDERQSILDVAKAQEDLNKVLADPTATENERKQAILNLEKQKLALEETRLANQRLGNDSAIAAAKGVAGSDAVVAAQDEVRTSSQGVADANQALADAQGEARLQQVQASRDISDAVRGIVDAQQALEEAYQSAGEAGAGAASQVSEAMKNISPVAREFVGEILGQADAWKKVKFAVQDKLFAGLAKEVKPLAEIYFPLLEEGAGGIADGLNGMAKEVVSFLKSGEAIENVRHIFGNTTEAVGNLKTVARDLFAAFLDIAAVGSDFLPDMATGASNAAARFREFIKEARESGKLKEWMQGGIDAVKELWQLLKNVGSIIGSVFSGLDQSGGGALATLTELTGKVATFLKTAEGQAGLKALGSILQSIGGAYGKIFLSFLETAAELLVILEPFITAVADTVGVALAAGWQLFGEALKPVAELIAWLSPFLGPFVGSIIAMNTAISLAKTAWAALNTTMKANPFVLIASLIAALIILIIDNWDVIGPKLKAMWEGLKTVAEAVWGAIERAIIDPLQRTWDFISGGLEGVANFFKTSHDLIMGGVRDAWNWIGDTISGMMRNIGNFITNGLGNIGELFRGLPGKIANWIKSLPGMMVNLGKDIINGILRGIGSIGSKIGRELKRLAEDAWRAVKNFFGISSPSKLMAYAGEMMGEGLVRGIMGMRSEVAKAATSMANAADVPMPGFDPSSPSGMVFSMTGQTSEPVGLTGAGRRPPTPPGAGATAGNVVNIAQLTVAVTGNLDPTNPVAWKRAMKEIKDGVRQVDRDYA